VRGFIGAVRIFFVQLLAKELQKKLAFEEFKREKEQIDAV